MCTFLWGPLPGPPLWAPYRGPIGPSRAGSEQARVTCRSARLGSALGLDSAFLRLSAGFGLISAGFWLGLDFALIWLGLIWIWLDFVWIRLDFDLILVGFTWIWLDFGLTIALIALIGLWEVLGLPRPS